MWQFLVLCQQTNKICRTHSWLILQCAHKTCKRFGHLYGRYHGQPVEARQRVVKMPKNMAFVFLSSFQGYLIKNGLHVKDLQLLIDIGNVNKAKSHKLVPFIIFSSSWRASCRASTSCFCWRRLGVVDAKSVWSIFVCTKLFHFSNLKRKLWTLQKGQILASDPPLYIVSFLIFFAFIST